MTRCGEDNETIGDDVVANLLDEHCSIGNKCFSSLAFLLQSSVYIRTKGPDHRYGCPLRIKNAWLPIQRSPGQKQYTFVPTYMEANRSVGMALRWVGCPF